MEYSSPKNSWETDGLLQRTSGFVHDPWEHSKLIPTFKETPLPHFIQNLLIELGPRLASTVIISNPWGGTKPVSANTEISWPCWNSEEQQGLLLTAVCKVPSHCTKAWVRCGRDHCGLPAKAQTSTSDQPSGTARGFPRPVHFVVLESFPSESYPFEADTLSITTQYSGTETMKGLLKILVWSLKSFL